MCPKTGLHTSRAGCHTSVLLDRNLNACRWPFLRLLAAPASPRLSCLWQIAAFDVQRPGTKIANRQSSIFLPSSTSYKCREYFGNVVNLYVQYLVFRAQEEYNHVSELLVHGEKGQ